MNPVAETYGWTFLLPNTNWFWSWRKEEATSHSQTSLLRRILGSIVLKVTKNQEQDSYAAIILSPPIIIYKHHIDVISQTTMVSDNLLPLGPFNM